MRFTLVPAHEGGNPPDDDDDVVAMALTIETPTREEEEDLEEGGLQQHQQSVEQFFQEIASELATLQHRGQAMGSINIVLRSAEGLAGPTSPFLPDLCTFLQHQPFEIATNRTAQTPLRLSVRLASDQEDTNNIADDDAVHVTRADPVVQEATDRICAAFWDNQRVRTARYLKLNVPVAPDAREVLERLFANAPASVTMLVYGALPRDPYHPSALPTFIKLGKVRIRTDESQMANVAKQVLRMSLAIPLDLCLHIVSPVAAGIVVEGLKEFRNHSFPSILISSSLPRRPPLDGTDLCWAVLRCPSVNALVFVGFKFSSSALMAVQEALAGSDPGDAAALKKLAFSRCVFPDSAVGPGELAHAMSSNKKLRILALMDLGLRESDVKSLCSVLTESDWELDNLQMGILNRNFIPTSIADDLVVHFFFRNLPSMKTLKGLVFGCQVPSSLSRTVVDGFKNNYWLVSASVISFAGDPDLAGQLDNEIKSFVAANAKGRTTIYRAVSNPDDQELQEEMIEVLHRLANPEDDDLDDLTALFLCLQLLLPNLGGAGDRDLAMRCARSPCGSFRCANGISASPLAVEQ